MKIKNILILKIVSTRSILNYEYNLIQVIENDNIFEYNKVFKAI